MTLSQRFHSKYLRGRPSQCWVWVGARHRQGYGQIKVDGKVVLAHRIAWFLHKGRRPPSHLKVCHTCDNPWCVNPKHLFLGTQRTNALDCVAKGRANRASRVGSKNNLAIFHESDVLKILDDKRKYREIAAHYECSESTIGMIKRGYNWPHVYKEWQANGRPT